jgi:hypothetical protein
VRPRRFWRAPRRRSSSSWSCASATPATCRKISCAPAITAERRARGRRSPRGYAHTRDTGRGRLAR